MTLFLPLEDSASIPATPSFLTESWYPRTQLSNAVKAILKARRIVVISGAGISVQAGIPDFRSPDGLFQSLKRDNPRDSLVSGKDLFDASVFKVRNPLGQHMSCMWTEIFFDLTAPFQSEHTTSLFCQMIARLSELSKAAEPTPFHRLLQSLDDSGKLLRVYTQNIDAIETKCGLSFGVPEFEEKKTKSAYRPSHVEQPSSSRLPTPPRETPRCIPLHGTLQMIHCQICNHSFPLDDYVTSLLAGVPPHCPECTALERTREVIGKRSRGIGKLRPSVVLYNEAHKDGEGVGEVVRRDLVGSSKGKGRSGADLLLVVGTSLRVPGTKRMVREFSKAVRCRQSSPTPNTEEESTFKSIYLNLDFPVPTREWEGVFDTWIQGDAQEFAELVQEELDREMQAKEASKRKKEEKLASPKTPSKKRKNESEPLTPTKRQKTAKPPTPKSTARRKSSSLILPTPVTPIKKNIIRIPPRPHFVPPMSSSTREFFGLSTPAQTPPRHKHETNEPWSPTPAPRGVKAARVPASHEKREYEEQLALSRTSILHRVTFEPDLAQLGISSASHPSPDPGGQQLAGMVR
ncbi:DHS-like NAD/FAD-binding domain-containing protein [Armillaria luteobubalina]|uniref:DHS-like NAD/FAD-binding domain-containing protein n=1 Tax=Armillaria luteobubalina TaxID=153913 RepID=A0AA39Q334_9AGAR|nr:DHS-like NAD/FAD-binding domain-containing protein [Armillaria luteobubalina]